MQRILSFAVHLVVLALFAVACSGSATVDRVEPAVEPTTERAPQAAEPTAVPPVDDATTPVVPVALPTDSLLGISPDGRHGYASTGDIWGDPVACDSAVTESIAVVDLAAVAAGTSEAISTGLAQSGTAIGWALGANGRVAVLSECGTNAEIVAWVQSFAVEPDGRLRPVSDVISLGPNSDEISPWSFGWLDDDTLTFQRVFYVADDFEASTTETWRVAVSAGETELVEVYGLYEDRVDSRSFVSPDGQFSYTATPDPDGRLGCEGARLAVTLEVDDGATRRPAVERGTVFSNIDEMHFSADGYVAWTTNCEGYATAYVGRVQPDGLIADAHYVETYDASTETWIEAQYYRLTGDGYLAAFGAQYTGESEPVLKATRFDLTADPNFVNTAQPALDIDPTPLFAASQPGATWHVGESRLTEPACGGSTLYARTSFGFTRAFGPRDEIDTIVDVDLTEALITESDFGPDWGSRTVVFQTECPGDYAGRQVWFGVEDREAQYGLFVEQADLGEVADVLSVRDVLNPDGRWVERRFVTVEYLDGSVSGEIELVAVPVDG